ncbi:TlpA family protein disulfide reductase [Streptomyces sp. SR-10]|uniref:TlpA family protein disulfide reductase n=1 Tax=Streptomyces sp. SR-10 TaxID=3416442 RepID=UPI003CEAD4D8
MTTTDPQAVGINADVSVGEARAFGKDAELVYPSLYDPRRSAAPSASEGRGEHAGYPFTIIVDPEGRPAATRIGAIDEAELKRLVTPILPILPT